MKTKRAATQEIIPLPQLERVAILAAVEQLEGNMSLAAEKLGIGKTTLYRRLKEYGVVLNERRRKGKSG